MSTASGTRQDGGQGGGKNAPAPAPDGGNIINLNDLAPGGMGALAEIVTATQDWFQHKNEARLRWAHRHGFTLGDVTLRDGLIDFPGLGNRSPSPDPGGETSEGAPHPFVPDATAVKLWKDFLSQLEALDHVPSFWSELTREVRDWIDHPSEEATADLYTLAKTCLKQYLITFTPVNMMYFLMMGSDRNTEWLKGADKRGTITVATVRQCLASALDGMENANREISMAFKSRDRLGRLFTKCSTIQLPFIFRYLFVDDEEFKHEVASTLQGEYGIYKELDFEKLIIRLEDDWDKESQRAGRMREKTEGGGVV